MGCWCGQRIGLPLSTLTVKVAGLYIPPGEILVGGFEEFGRTQTVPLLPWSSEVGESPGVDCRAGLAAKLAIKRTTTIFMTDDYMVEVP